ncbi:MAG: HEAT repeat domain-containing protein [Deltaproteobacteria bacterium]|nr:HEAT repeat domain-containing protein [Deltaproteobacteria bacterium]
MERPDARAPLAAPSAPGARSPADVTALLVELGRLVKARQFYPDRHPLLRDVFDRGFRVFEAEIRRGGPLEIEVRQGGFRLAGEVVGRGRVDDLAQDFVRRAIRRLGFDVALTQAAIERLVAVLATEPEQLAQIGGFVRALYTDPCPGIRVNEMDYSAALAQAGAARVSVADAEGTAAGVAAALAPAGFGVAGLSAGVVDGAGLAGDGAVAGALALLAGEPKPEPLGPAHELERAPLDACFEDDRASELVTLLRELDAANDDVRYRDLAREASVLAAALSDDGLDDEGYRAILVLAAHAASDERTDAVRTAAHECLRELTRGRRLDALIERACAPGEGASLRAAQTLLRIGSPAVPALLHRVEAEQDLDRRGQLFGILIAMGDATTGDLCDAMQSGERRRAGLAIRLAGEMQNGGTLDALIELLGSDDADLRREAAKALVRIGSPDAIEALASALRSPHEGMPAHAAFCLGVAGGARAFEALLATARREGGGPTLDLAREAVRALGRMGRPETVPVLAKILERRSLLRRRRLRELQLAAVAALAKLPGDASHAALAHAASHGSAAVREAAKRAASRSGPGPVDRAAPGPPAT